MKAYKINNTGFQLIEGDIERNEDGSPTDSSIVIYTENNIPAELQLFLDTQNEKQDLQIKLAEAKLYLASTDYKVLPDYDKPDAEIVAKRQEAREFIRANENA